MNTLTFKDAVQNALTRKIPSFLQNDSASTGHQLSLQDFFKRPVIVWSGFWPTTSNAGDVVTSINIATALTSYPIWTNKLKGYLAFRAKAKIRVTINASPFQQGALLAFYTPSYPVGHPSVYNGHLVNLMAMSQLPGVRLTTANREAILEIPWIAPVSHYKLVNPNYEWGIFYLNVLSPLKTGSSGPNNVEYTVFLSFEDAEFETPMQTQSDVGAVPSRRRRWRVKNVTEQEAEGINAGPIEKVFKSAGSLAQAAQGVPILSSIAGPARWVMDIGAKACHLFGWSKPLDESNVMRIARSWNAFSWNAEGKDLSQPLALMSQNKVELLADIPGHDFDEMSIDFIKQQWSYFSTFSWNSNDLSNIWSCTLQPSFFYHSRNGTNDQVAVLGATMSPLTFLADMFSFYRGGIRLKFRFIKTKFHSGAVAIAFTPVQMVPPPTDVQLSEMHAEIFNLETTDVITLDFPYCSVNPYLRVDEPFGYVYVNVVNELRAPDAVASSVDVVVEVSASDDMEFAVPRYKWNSPMIQQMALDDDDQEITKPISDVSRFMDGAMYASTCIGEKITSLRQFLTSYNRVWIKPTAPNQGTAPSAGSGGFNPNVPGILSLRAAAGGDMEYCGLGGDAFNTFASCYAFRRGGVRIRANYQTCPNGALVTMMPDTLNTYYGVSNPGTAYDDSFVPPFTTTAPYIPTSPFKYYYQPGSDNSWSVQTPYYSAMPIMSNAPYFVDGTGTAVMPRDRPNTRIWYRSDGSTGMNISRAVADDFQFSYWIGVPWMSYTN